MEIKTKFNNLLTNNKQVMDAIVLVLIVIAIGVTNIFFCMINIYYNNKYLKKTEEYIERLEQTRKQIIELEEIIHGD